MIGKLVKKLTNTNVNEFFLEELLNSKFNKKKLEEICKEYEIDLNYLDSNGDSFLHTALEHYRNESALWLLSKDININVENKKGIVPFDIAIQNQNHRVVKKIIEKENIDKNKKDIHGRTYLQDAVILGDHEMAKILIENNADVNSRDNKGQNILFDAISYGNKNFIEYIIELKGLELSNIDNEGNTVLHNRYMLENDDIALKLIENGVNPNIRNKEGETYLSIVAQRGVESFYIIESSVKNGFDINSKVSNKNNILMEVLSALSNIDPMDEAKRHSLVAMGKKLIEIGIDVNATNVDGETALFQTVKANDLESTKMLLENKIDVNIQNNNGETALFYSCYGGIEKLLITIKLIKYKADPTIADNKNQTILEVLNNLVLSNHGKEEFIDNSIMKYAISGTRFMNVLKAIFKYTKYKLDFLDSKGNPIFFNPLLYDHISLFKLYLKKGVDIHMLNKEGKNLFFVYVEKVFEDDEEDIEFETGLSMLISAKVDHNSYDETGWTVVSKIIAKTSCNINLFKSLIKRVRFDYKVVDKLGRSVIHSAVWSGRVDVLKMINHIDPDIKNVSDHYGILPVIYASLIGNKEVLLSLIKLKTQVKTKKPISQAAIRKFSPLLKNIEKLIEDSINESEKRVMIGISKQLEIDFVIR